MELITKCFSDYANPNSYLCHCYRSVMASGLSEKEIMHNKSCNWPPSCEVLQHVKCCLLKFEYGQILANNTHHVVTRWPKAHNMPTQHIATLLVATYCARLATLLRHCFATVLPPCVQWTCNTGQNNRDTYVGQLKMEIDFTVIKRSDLWVSIKLIYVQCMYFVQVTAL